MPSASHIVKFQAQAVRDLPLNSGEEAVNVRILET
jgi:hypothetical protein